VQYSTRDRESAYASMNGHANHLGAESQPCNLARRRVCLCAQVVDLLNFHPVLLYQGQWDAECGVASNDAWIQTMKWYVHLYV
jgi:hypothetical protein